MAFDNFLTQEQSKPTKLRTITFSIAIGLHAGLLIFGVYMSFWNVEELSPPSVSVTFLAGAPPPPPPPPPPKRKKAETKVVKPTEIVQPKPSQIVQPKEKPPEPEEEDEGEEGGVEGGVAGGVAGGIVGGTVGSTGTGPVMLAPAVGTGQRISSMDDPRYKPTLPPALNRAGMVQWGLYKICVSAQGKVTGVTVLKAADPLVNDDWVAKIKTWEYRPYSVNGRPVPFCSPTRVQVQAQN